MNEELYKALAALNRALAELTAAIERNTAASEKVVKDERNKVSTLGPFKSDSTEFYARPTVPSLDRQERGTGQ